MAIAKEDPISAEDLEFYKAAMSEEEVLALARAHDKLEETIGDVEGCKFPTDD